jgi:hypothetical protein
VSQLKNEFQWVDAVNALIGNLQAPFEQNETNTIVDVQNIATQIYGTVKPQPPSSTNVSFGWLNIFDGVMDVLSAVPGLPGAAVFGLLGAGGDLAGALVQNYAGSSASGGPGSPAYKIHVEAVNLSTQLANQTQQYMSALGLLGIILVSDAGKLLAVGSQVLGNADWEWTNETTKNAVTFLNATTGPVLLQRAAAAYLVAMEPQAQLHKRPDQLRGPDDLGVWGICPPVQQRGHVQPVDHANYLRQHVLLEIPDDHGWFLRDLDNRGVVVRPVPHLHRGPGTPTDDLADQRHLRDRFRHID